MSLDEDSVVLGSFIKQRHNNDVYYYSKETQRSYTSALNEFFRWFSKKKLFLSTLDTAILIEWKSSLSGAKSSRSHAISAVRSFLKYAYRHNACPRTLPLQLRRPAQTRHYLSDSDIEDKIKKIKDNINLDRRKALIYTARGFGLKTSELSDLTAKQLCETTGVPEEFNMPSFHEWHFFYYKPEQLNSAKKERTIPVRKHYADQYHNFVSKLSSNNKYVFGSLKKGEHIGIRGLDRIIEEIPVSLSELRNTYIADLVRTGLSIEAIAQATGMRFSSAKNAVKLLKTIE